MRKAIALSAVVLLLSGCGPTLREAITNKSISNTRMTGVGVIAQPLGSGPEAPLAGIGFLGIQHQFAPTSTEGDVKAAPLINRTDAAGPFGSRITDTTGIGSVGEQIDEDVVDALEALHGGKGDAEIPATTPIIPLPEVP